MSWFKARHKGTDAEVPAAYIARLEKYAAPYIPGDIHKISTQRKMLEMLKPLFMIEDFMLNPTLQGVFASNDLDGLNPNDFASMVAVDVNRWLSNFKAGPIEHRMQTMYNIHLAKCWIVLTRYSQLLKPDSRHGLDRYINRILSTIWNNHFYIPDRKA